MQCLKLARLQHGFNRPVRAWVLRIIIREHVRGRRRDMHDVLDACAEGCDQEGRFLGELRRLVVRCGEHPLDFARAGPDRSDLTLGLLLHFDAGNLSDCAGGGTLGGMGHS